MTNWLRAAWKAVSGRGKRGLALVAGYLANVLWLLDASWQTLIHEGYGRNSVAYSALRLLAQSIPEARLRGYTGKDDNRKPLPDTHPLTQLIARPNPLMTEFELWELTTIQLAVVGRSVWWKERANNGQVLALWPLRPDRVAPVYSSEPGEVLTGWAYIIDGVIQNSGQPLPASDCIAFNFPDPDGASGGIVEGFGPLSAARADLSSDNLATAHTGALLANYAQPGIALKIADPVDEATANLIKAKFRQEFGGSRLGTPAVLDAGADIAMLGFSLKDLEFTGLRADTESRLCAALGVPSILVGVNSGLESSTYSNFEEARLFFAETTLAFYWRRYADQMTLDLAAEFGEEIVCEFDTATVKALAAQFGKQVAPWKEAFTQGAITLNQYARKLGLEPFPPEVGDMLYVPNAVTLTPATKELIAKAEAEKEKAKQELAEQMQQQAEEKPEEETGQNPPDNAGPKPQGEAETDDEMPMQGGKAIRAVRWDDERQAAEVRLMKALLRLFRTVAPEIAAKLARGEMPSNAELEKALARVIEVELLETATDEVLRLGHEVGVQFEPGAANTAMASWAHTHAGELVRGISDTTQKSLQQIMVRFAETPGMTREELESAILRALDEGGAVFSEARAQAIAVTETTRAASAAHRHYQEELGKMGLEFERVWHTDRDELVCPICVPLDGQPESEWAGQFPDGPAAHVNCRCSTSLRMKKKQAAA